jgi:hypothetical protein
MALLSPQQSSQTCWMLKTKPNRPKQSLPKRRRLCEAAPSRRANLSLSYERNSLKNAEKSMQARNNCPICFSTLEVREVTPCYRCGGWEAALMKSFDDYQLPDGSLLTLCSLCLGEEIFGDQGDLKQRIKISHHRELSIDRPRAHASVDKYCIECNARFALLKLMAHRLNPAELNTFAPAPVAPKKPKKT